MTENLTNIWGLQGCKLPNGEQCTSCCTVLGICSPGHPLLPEIDFIKDPNQACWFSTPKGCDVYSERPLACVQYHCSQSRPDIQLRLIDQAVESGQVPMEDAQAAVERIISRGKDNLPPN